MSEIDALRAQVKVLNRGNQSLRAEVAALRAERDRLLHENSGVVEEIHQAEERAERAEADVERMCKALIEGASTEHQKLWRDNVLYAYRAASE